jgi:hypothetical protein
MAQRWGEHSSKGRLYSTPRKCGHTITGKRLKSGERGRNRTYNLLIKSQLLCQLSYAPSANREVGTNFDYSIGVTVLLAESTRSLRIVAALCRCNGWRLSIVRQLLLPLG